VRRFIVDFAINAQTTGTATVDPRKDAPQGRGANDGKLRILANKVAQPLVDFLNREC